MTRRLRLQLVPANCKAESAQRGKYRLREPLPKLIVFGTIVYMSTTPEKMPARIVRIAPEELSAANQVAQLAARLWEQKRGAENDRWEAAKKAHFNQRNRLLGYPDKLQELDKEWEKRTAEHYERLTPAGYLPEAWELLEKARELATRPQTNIEYLVEHGGSDDAITETIDRHRRERLIPFKKLCDPERKLGDVELIGNISWPVYRSKKRCEEMLWRYANLQSKKWRETEGQDLERWVKGKAVPDGFPPLTEIVYGTIEKRKEVAERWLRGERIDGFPRFSVPGYDSEDKRGEAASKWVEGKVVPECFPPFTKKDSIKRRAEIMKEQTGIDFLSTTLQQDLVKWNEQNWISTFQKWREDGIPPEDFLAFHNFRRNVRQVRLKNLPTRSRKQRRKK